MSDPDSPLTHDPNPPPPAKNPRRLPPPCWSLEETIALIEGYREKWHSLNRGNLKANHWEDVAESVAVSCPDVALKKTAVQCRHKMEKLRKRYRTEIQRARSVPVARFISSWVHFKRMEAMENRFESKPEEEPRFFNRNGSAGSSGGGIRIRIPTAVSLAPSQSLNPRPSRVGAGKRGREMFVKEEEEEEGDPVVEVAGAIKLLGDALLKTEQSKMDMCIEIEAMRNEMEIKRTKMILESQQKIVEAFAKGLSEEGKEKKARRMSSSSLPDHMDC